MTRANVVLDNPAVVQSEFEKGLTDILENLHTSFSSLNARHVRAGIANLRELLSHRSAWLIDEVVEDFVEDRRERAILEILKQAKTLAKYGDSDYCSPLRIAFLIANLELGGDYESQPGRYCWLEKIAQGLACTYNKAHRAGQKE